MRAKFVMDDEEMPALSMDNLGNSIANGSNINNIGGGGQRSRQMNLNLNLSGLGGGESKDNNEGSCENRNNSDIMNLKEAFN